MNAQAAWLQKGHFVLGEDQPSFTVATRDELCRATSLSHLEIVQYPNHPGAWRHSLYWREGEVNYAEAQFFASIAKEYPILSLGVSVEKGLEHASASGDDLMNRKTWDWVRFVKEVQHLASVEVEKVAEKRPGQAVTLRIWARRYDDSANEPGHETRSFSFFEKQWFKRHGGDSSPSDIAEYVAEIDRREGSWAFASFSHDLGPGEAERLSPLAAAEILLAFDGIRRRLHR